MARVMRARCGCAVRRSDGASRHPMTTTGSGCACATSRPPCECSNNRLWAVTVAAALTESIAATRPLGRLTAVIGPVGAGKSSLLAALLGELDLADGALYSSPHDRCLMTPSAPMTVALMTVLLGALGCVARMCSGTIIDSAAREAAKLSV